jgi:autotransporter strand-loop-strand O-heptosyltransferase
MLKVRAHTCYLGTTGYTSHARSFFREFSKYVNLRIRNYTWDDNPEYLDELDFSLIDTITLLTESGKKDFHISHGFPNLPWKNHTESFIPDVDIVLMDMNSEYFYEKYSAPVKIAYTVWESTKLPESFLNQLLKFDYLWVVSEWHKKVVVEQGYPAYRVFIINEGVNYSLCDDNPPKQLPEFDDNRFKFLFFGRWDYRKSVPEIIRTFLDTFDSSEPVDLILSADNPYSIDGLNSTEERLTYYGFNDERVKVKHFVSREDYISYIKTGNVFLSCARSEGWNIPLIEAMAAGTPAIYSNWGAQLEFAKDKGIPVSIREEREASIGSDLGFAGYTPGLYAEPDFEDLGRVMRDSFIQYEFYKNKAEIEKNEIREKFSWSNVAISAYLELLKVCDFDLPEINREDAVIIMSHADTREKEILLKLSIISIKRQGYTVIVSSHIPLPSEIYKIVDYVVYDKENPVVYPEEYSLLSDTVPLHFIKYKEFELEYLFEFNHGYAALKLIKNGLSIANVNNFKISHCINYDYIIYDTTVLESHNEDLSNNDVVSYKWDSNESLNSALFSCKTNIAVKSLEKFNSKSDYFMFPNVIILEDFLYKAFEKDGMRIKLHNISKLSNENYLNSYVLSTYPSIESKSDKESFLYLSKDKDTNEYILCVIGSDDEPLKIKINYRKKFCEIIADPKIKSVSLFRITEEMINDGFEIELLNQKEKRTYNKNTRIAMIKLNNPELLENLKFDDSNFKINVNFIDGPFVEILGECNDEFIVSFYDKKEDNLVHQSMIKNNMWTKASRKYYTDWRISITKKGEEVYTTDLSLSNCKVYITIDSSSIGDSIAWIPYVEEFRKKHNCEVVVSTFWNHLFKDSYKDLTFVTPGTTVMNMHAVYKIGCFYDSNLEPELCNTIPLQKVACNILGLDYQEIKTKIDFNKNKKVDSGKYVTLAPHSTAGLKYWNNSTGWQEVVDYLKSKNYKVYNVSREGCNLNGVENIQDYSMDTIIQYINGSEFFIGLSSGLSWLAWSINKHVFLISNFTNKEHEFSHNCTRIVNESVCNSCWVIPEHRFDKGDWNWCPLHKGTERQFECSKSIKGIDVIDKIDNYILNNTNKDEVNKALDESYELGMVQNRKEIFEAAQHFKLQNVKNFLEIGTDQGGTFAIWSKLSKNKDGIRISVDLPHGPYGVNTYNVSERDNYLKRLGTNVTTIHGSSHNEEIKNKVNEILNGELLDFLFIDGDHTYNGVKLDYLMYKEFVKPGGWIGFHDIKDTEFHKNANCGVDILWKELIGEKVEFVDNSSDFGGIGFVKVPIE